MCEECGTRPRIQPETGGGMRSWRWCHECFQARVREFRQAMGWTKYL